MGSLIATASKFSNPKRNDGNTEWIVPASKSGRVSKWKRRVTCYIKKASDGDALEGWIDLDGTREMGHHISVRSSTHPLVHALKLPNSSRRHTPPQRTHKTLYFEHSCSPEGPSRQGHEVLGGRDACRRRAIPDSHGSSTNLRPTRKARTASHLPRRFVPTERQYLWSGALIAGRDVREACETKWVRCKVAFFEFPTSNMRILVHSM